AQAASVLLFALVAGGCSVKEKIEDASSGTGSSSGTASAPRVLSFVAAPTVSLGNVPIGSTKLIFVSIATTGSGNATISSTSNSDSHFTYNGGSFPGTGGTCTQPIQGNCSIALLFTAPTNPG